MSAQAYILLGKHRLADGTLLTAGDELKLTPQQAQGLAGKVVLASAQEAADAIANSSTDERIAALTEQVESLTAQNADLQARLDSGEEKGEAKPGLVQRAVNTVTGNNTAQANDESVRRVDQSGQDSQDL